MLFNCFPKSEESTSLSAFKGIPGSSENTATAQALWSGNKTKDDEDGFCADAGAGASQNNREEKGEIE